MTSLVTTFMPEKASSTAAAYQSTGKGSPLEKDLDFCKRVCEGKEKVESFVLPIRSGRVSHVSHPCFLQSIGAYCEVFRLTILICAGVACSCWAYVQNHCSGRPPGAISRFEDFPAPVQGNLHRAYPQTPISSSRTLKLCI